VEKFLPPGFSRAVKPNVAMKSRWDESEFNTPQEMLVRASYLACLVLFTAGILATLAGAASHNVPLVLLGFAALGLAALSRGWLRRHGHFDAAEAAFNEVARLEPPLDVARVTELIRLLREWEAAEKKRGSPEFDPWTVQSLRHDIRAMVETDPALERLFHV
jgi:hypothetical protein